MERIILPNGLEVSNVALGAMDFSTTTSKQKAFAVLDVYLDMGGNFVNTSNNHAHWQGTGDESLRKLQTDYIVLYCAHADDPNQHWRKPWRHSIG